MKVLAVKMQADKFVLEITLVWDGLICSLLFFTNFAGNLTDKNWSKICVFPVSDACAKAKKKKPKIYIYLLARQYDTSISSRLFLFYTDFSVKMVGKPK